MTPATTTTPPPHPASSADDGPACRSPLAAASGRRDRDGSHVHCYPFRTGGGQLCPCGIVTATPQTFTVTSRRIPRHTGEGVLRHHLLVAGTHRNPAPYLPNLELAHVLEELYPLVPCVHLCPTLAEPAPFGSAGTFRLCQGCSHLPRRHPDRLPSATAIMLRHNHFEVITPPIWITAPRGARPGTGTSDPATG